MNEMKIVERLNRCIKNIPCQDIRIMEVCGTHTRAVSKSGIRYLLPPQVKLLSGPGCPVCVTPVSYIDMAIELLNSKEILLATFGDMMKVSGNYGSLWDKKSECAGIVVVYSPEDTIAIASNNKDKTVVFAAVGFETTAPLIAATVKLADACGLDNLFFLTSLKCMEPVIHFILQDERSKIHAMLCPGHVASIKGADYFRFITDEFHMPAVVCGFETADITAGICLLLEQLVAKRPAAFVNLYKQCVRSSGNIAAQHILKEVFDVADGDWRGIGRIRNSALVLNERYEYLDAAKKFGLNMNQPLIPENCLCSDILLGVKLPQQCSSFGTSCTPEHPSGPCMVSSEGSCAVHFRYGGGDGNER